VPEISLIDLPVTGDIVVWVQWAIRSYAKISLWVGARYLAAAAIAFLLLWVVFRRPMKSRKIQKSFLSGQQVRREVFWSLSTVLITGLFGVGVIFLIQSGWSRLYLSIGVYGWWYWAGSLIVMIVLHDAWFYWTHRAMHHPRLFPIFHQTHHRSVSPSPWAAYSFAPPEAMVQVLFLPILLMVMPLHPLTIAVWGFHQITRNVLGHSGYELFPRGTPSHWLGQWLTTHTYHDLHHSAGTGNFGLYFTWWDRLMGTTRQDYATAFSDVTGGPETVVAPGSTMMLAPEPDQLIEQTK